MFVCVCHAIRERDVAGAIDTGAQSIGQVYQQLGVRPSCAKCVPHIRDMTRSATDHSDNAA